MKKLALLIVIVLIQYLQCFAQDPNSGWIQKNTYLEQKLKIGQITYMKFSEDGKYFYTFSKDKNFRKWDSETGELIKSLFLDYNIESLDFDQIEEKIILIQKNSFIEDYKAYIIDFNQMIPNIEFNPVFDIEINSPYEHRAKIVINPKQKLIISTIHYYNGDGSGSESRYLMHNWSSENGTLCDSIYQDFDNRPPVLQIFNNFGDKIATHCFYEFYQNEKWGNEWSFQTILSITNLVDKSNIKLNKSQSRNDLFNINLMKFSYDDKYLCSVTNGFIRIWDMETLQFKDIPKKYKFNLAEYLFKNDFMVTNSEKGTIEILNLPINLVYESFSFDSSKDFIIKTCPDSVSVLTGSDNGVLRLIKPQIISKNLKCDFLADIKVLETGDTLHFQDFSSGNVTSRTWDFGDGTRDSVSYKAHTYNLPGLYTVKLIVSDGNTTDSLIKTEYIKVVSKIIPEFEADKISGRIPLEVNFRNLSSGDLKFVEWDFGDGSKSNDNNPNHTFVNPGKYTIKLDVTDSVFKKSITKTKYIDVRRDSLKEIGYNFEDEIYHSDASFGISSVIVGDKYFMGVKNYTKYLSEFDSTNILSSTSLCKIDKNGNVDSIQIFSYNYWYMNYLKKADDTSFFQFCTYSELVKDFPEDILDFGFYVCKINSDGQKIWSKKIPYWQQNIEFWDFITMNNGESIIFSAAGNIPELVYINKDFYLITGIKYSSLNIGDNKAYRPRLISFGNSNLTMITQALNSNIKLTKLKMNGDIIWTKDCFTESKYRIGNFLQTSNGDYFVTGTILEDNKSYIKRLDSNAQAIWIFTSDSSVSYQDIALLNDTLMVVVGSINGKSGFTIIDVNMNRQDFILDSRPGRFNAVSVDKDGSLFLVGTYRDDKNQYNAYYLHTVAYSQFYMGASSVFDKISTNNVYPNPSKGDAVIEFDSDTDGIVNIDLIDINGNIHKILNSNFYQLGRNQFRFNLDNFSNGIYLYNIYLNGKYLSSGKIAIIK